MLYWSIISGASFLLLVFFDETICGTVPKTGVHLKPVSGPEASAARLKKTIVDAHSGNHGFTNPPAHKSSLHGKKKPLDDVVASNSTVTIGRLLPSSKGGSILPQNPQSSSFVAFTVSNSGPQQGPYLDVKIVTFNKVITNIGGGFDPMFNVFTSKVSGVYFFSVSVVGVPDRQAVVNLVHDGRNILLAHGHHPHGTGVLTAYLHVVAGGRVWVSLQVKQAIFGHYSSFSGSLVKLDGAT